MNCPAMTPPYKATMLFGAEFPWWIACVGIIRQRACGAVQAARIATSTSLSLSLSLSLSSIFEPCCLFQTILVAAPFEQARWFAYTHTLTFTNIDTRSHHLYYYRFLPDIRSGAYPSFHRHASIDINTFFPRHFYLCLCQYQL